MHNLILISLFLISFVCSEGTTKNINNEPGNKNREGDSVTVNKPGNNIPGKDQKVPDALNDKQAIIPASEKMEWAFGKNYKPFTPSMEDIQAAENILDACYGREVAGTYNPFFGRKLDAYYRQYVGAENSNGEKIIYINCFCSVIKEYKDKWKTELVMVDDGGNCYFNVKANLTKKIDYDLMVNGLP